MEINVLDKNGEKKVTASGSNRVDLVYTGRYKKGDYIELNVSVPGFYEVCFEDTMPPALLYILGKAVFAIPFGRMNRVPYNPRSFKGYQHLLYARKACPEQIYKRRNLALNPYDQDVDTGAFPHAAASTQTRGEALFAARNAIDGVFTNSGHFPWPYQSWGINKDPDAVLNIEFGIPVVVDEIILTLRADYPHDSYWTSATIEFSDGSRETFALQKSAKPQCFAISPRVITFLELKELIKAEDKSPFPALTQIEVWGIVKGGTV